MQLDSIQESQLQVEYLWPDCVDIWAAWQGVQTQWRTGMAGATGLDYAAVLAWLRDCGPSNKADRREWFACIQAAERATLQVWAEQAAEADANKPA